MSAHNYLHSSQQDSNPSHETSLLDQEATPVALKKTNSTLKVSKILPKSNFSFSSGELLLFRLVAGLENLVLFLFHLNTLFR